MKIYLVIVGAIYLVLSVWCSLAPTMTSQSVGFTRNGAAGASEFLTVYGGLELGMAMIFALPLVRPKSTAYALAACVAIHAALVAFRTAGMFLYPGSLAATWKLAVGEWVILTVGIGISIRNRRWLRRRL